MKHEREVTDEQGATAVEYGLMVALIAAIIMGSVALLGEAVFGIFQGTLSWPW
ncbi:Flp family type IVb pilin [Nocardioides eburneiflavus]|uniref:Flp family type IVb pilin n=1 Tax=Nocardioides eburneiflavus TaxID=2518372 RepID=A0A4Z1CLL8_9ACTN|nr:Flp family type IVb pilin [Nocardioides eburneiflavus]TGN66180.1 Flp family type IVb pilin [Nocardioides eburneiflavus]